MSVLVNWYGHASFRISAGKSVFIDPWKLPAGIGPADVVIVSHSHYDHCSPPDVATLRGRKTVVLAPRDAAEKLGGKVTTISPHQSQELQGITIETIPAYNPNKQFHPKGNGWIGVIVTIEGKRIYYAGDTDLIPEMSNIRNIDLALLPVGGTYTMNAKEAAQATKTINPTRAVPYHWGDIVGAQTDADQFAAQAGCPVVVLTPGQSLTL